VATGVRSVRVGVSWAMLQPDRPTAGDGGWSWSWGIPRVDSVVHMALERGLVVHATFGRTPAWANNGAGEAAAPTSLADWRRALRFVVHRYAGKITSWEIWNEPNLPKYFSHGTAASYTRLLCAAYPVVHAESPSAPVVFGGVSGNDWRFVRAAYRAGAKGCFDVLGVHPYQRWGFAPAAPAPNSQPWYFANVALVRQVQREFHDLEPIWFTEVGWSTHSNGPGLPEYERGVSEHRQADYLVQTLELTRQRYRYVARVYIYQARDETEFSVENNNFGLFTVRLTPKPAVSALHRYLQAR
jgi:polysaccharide biosynthesis protein PslG